MNVAVVSKRINTALGRRTTPHLPSSQFDAWHRWLGALDGRYKRWTFEPAAWAAVGPQVRDAVLSVAVPALELHVSDMSLRDRWLTKTDISPAFENPPTRLGRLLILLEAIGPRSEIAVTRAELSRLAAAGSPGAILWLGRQPGADPERLFVHNASKVKTAAAWRRLAQSSPDYGEAKTMHD